jgi:predicted 3-demethylubiquinone-9 3-methyltransferase (glyoxalase superfamily)
MAPTKTASTTQAKQTKPSQGLDTITPCLWFDRQAEEAARFYVSIFPESSLDRVVPSPSDYPAGKKGDTVLVEFTLMGRKFTALNGGPYFHLNEAVSFYVPCKDQAEVDRYWKALSAVPEAEQCGWLKDKFGASWQIVPTRMFELLVDPDPKRAARAYQAMMDMKKLDVAALERAANGK